MRRSVHAQRFSPIPLGTTGVMIPEMGGGIWRYKGGPALLRRAVEMGATLVDTAEDVLDDYPNPGTIDDIRAP